MKISFSFSKETSRFIVTAIERDRVVYAEEHNGNESLLDVVNAIRYDLGMSPVAVKNTNPNAKES